MRFLLDQDVYAATARFLRDSGHDVVTAGEIGCSKAADSELLNLAQSQDRIFITRDFGSLVYLKHLGSGVIYLRVLPSTLNTVHQEIETVLRNYSEDELKDAFVVVEPGRHRFRKLSP